tara:strand:- start:508 stop:972 length:465 start_codon:yes stop_codon:yes gene_type:complete
MKKFDNTGGIASVRTIPMMNQGGSAEQRLADGPPPKQFSLPQEEKVIPSEPRVIPQQRMNTFPIPVPGDRPISSEPNFDTGAQDFPGPGLEFQEFIFNTPTINPKEVYPSDPDPGIMSLPGVMNPNMLGMNPNLLQANMLKPAGILSINKTYDI